MTENLLMQSIKSALLDLEEQGGIVLCASEPDFPAKFIYEAVSGLAPSDQLTITELAGLRSLVFQAVSDKRFFDWEMPTLTGLTADQFKAAANKLPKR